MSNNKITYKQLFALIANNRQFYIDSCPKLKDLIEQIPQGCAVCQYSKHRDLINRIVNSDTDSLESATSLIANKMISIIKEY